MAHNIGKKDSCVTLAPTWHKLETIAPEIDYENSGLNWTVEREQISLEKNGKKIDSHYAVYSPEKDEVINIAKDSYTIIQNSQLFEIINDSLIGVPFKIEAAVSLGDLKKVAITISLDDNQDYLINGEDFKNYMSFVSSHDGSLNLMAYDSSHRVICANTLQWSLKDKGLLNLRVRHTKNCQIKIDNMKEEIEELLKKREDFYTSYEYLCSRPMTLDQAEKILVGFEATDELSTRSKNKVEKIKDLFVSGLGNKGETMADLFNGITQYYTSGSSDNPGKAWASSEFGAGRDKKLAFWDALQSDKEIDRLAKRGESLLALA
jgi:phage/plasmid-like protein (TIGR03299 family)